MSETSGTDWPRRARDSEPAPASRRSVLGAVGGLAGLGAPRRAVAQAWPVRPVRVVVPYPGGSTPDVAARALLDHFRNAFGQPFVADNRAGAGGNLGTDAIAKATDGHTIGVSILGPLATAPAMFRNLPYDPARDLAPVSNLVQAPQLLVVHPSVPATDIAGLVAEDRARPGRLSFGSVGPGSFGHLGVEEIKARFGLDLVHVPYRGFPQAVVDLVAGRVQVLLLTAAGILPQLRDGSARGVAATGHRRLPDAPGVPTLAEQGLSGMESHGWIGLVAPAATPPERVERLAAEARAALLAPQAKASLEKIGFEVVGSGPEDFRRLLAGETDRWAGLVRRLGITADS